MTTTDPACEMQETKERSESLPAYPALLTIPKAAKLVGAPRTTVWGWVQTNPVWQGCIAQRNGRRIYLSTQKMLDRNLLLARQ